MPQFANPAEIMSAFEALTSTDILKLGMHARALMRRQPRSPYTEGEDLISEALHRALEGRRKWPVDVPFQAFMCETMRSVINHDTDNMNNKPGVHAAFDEAEVDNHHWSLGLFAPSAEDQYAASERRMARLGALEAADRALCAEGDDLARHVLRGMVDELSQSELAAHTKAGPLQLAAARKRVQRRLMDALDAPRSIH